MLTLAELPVGKMTDSGGSKMASNLTSSILTGAMTTSYAVLNLQATPLTDRVASSVPLGIICAPVNCAALAE